MLSNAYFLAKFRFDTAENEPAKNLLIFPILLTLIPNRCGLLLVRHRARLREVLLDEHRQPVEADLRNEPRPSPSARNFFKFTVPQEP